jgi:TRAP-type transport system small permease protein
MVSLVIVNVFLRYLFSYSIYWAEEVSTICFVWSVFLGSSAVYKHKMDIGIDVLVVRAPAQIQSVLEAAVKILLLIINSCIFYMSIVFTQVSVAKPTAVLGVSSAVVNLSLVVSFGLISFHSLRFIWADLKRNARHEEEA